MPQIDSEPNGIIAACWGLIYFVGIVFAISKGTKFPSAAIIVFMGLLVLLITTALPFVPGFHFSTYSSIFWLSLFQFLGIALVIGSVFLDRNFGNYNTPIEKNESRSSDHKTGPKTYPFQQSLLWIVGVTLAILFFLFQFGDVYFTKARIMLYLIGIILTLYISLFPYQSISTTLFTVFFGLALLFFVATIPVITLEDYLTVRPYRPNFLKTLDYFAASLRPNFLIILDFLGASLVVGAVFLDRSPARKIPLNGLGPVENSEWGPAPIHSEMPPTKAGGVKIFFKIVFKLAIISVLSILGLVLFITIACATNGYP